MTPGPSDGQPQDRGPAEPLQPGMSRRRQTESFGPEHRLTRRSDYQAAYAEGRKGHGRLVVVFARRRAETGPWRLGQTATRKVGGAVVRNGLRRHGREIFRRMKSRLPDGWDFVVNFKGGAVGAVQADLKADLIEVLRRLGMLTE